MPTTNPERPADLRGMLRHFLRPRKIRLPYPLEFPNWERLQGRYKAVLTLPFFSMVLVTAPAIFDFAALLANALGIPPDAPVRDQPNGVLWLVAFLTGFCVWVLAAWFVSVNLVAAILRARGSVTSAAAWALVLHGQCPEEWFADGPATVGLPGSNRE